jgi:hypothetical protein
MDWAIESRSETNSRKPRCDPTPLFRVFTANASALSSVSPRESASALADSYLRTEEASVNSLFHLSTNPLSELTPTTIVTSIDTSSSSPICASRAAAMNSDATEKLIDTERSAPIDDSAEFVAPAISSAQPPKDYTTRLTSIGVSCIDQEAATPQRSDLRTPLLDPRTSENPIAHSRTHTVTMQSLARVCDLKTTLFDRPLIHRQPAGAYLQSAICFLSDDSRRSSNSRLGSAIKKRSKSRTVAATNTVGCVQCAGAVYGCTLASLVQYCSVRGSQHAHVVGCIKSVLSPVAKSLKYIDGFDLHTLCAGLAAHRVLPEQVSRLGAMSHSDVVSNGTAVRSNAARRSLHPRLGNANTILGATASILCVYRVLTMSMIGSVLMQELINEAAFLQETDSLEMELQYALSETGPLNQGCSYNGVTPGPGFEQDAIEVERRALQRALCAVRACKQFAKLVSMNARQTLETSLLWYRKAAWPAGHVINERTQTALLEDLKRPLYYRAEIPLEHLPMPCGRPGPFVPLSRLENVEGGRVDGVAPSESEASSSLVTASSLSNVSSSGETRDRGTAALDGTLVDPLSYLNVS